MSTVTQAYVFALDPTRQQADGLRSHCGAARFAFNWGLATVKTNLSQRNVERSYGVPESALTPSLNWSAYGLRRDWNTAKGKVAPWWSVNSKEAYAGGLANLATALKNWSQSRSGHRKGPGVRFPRFKSKRVTWSYSVTTGAFGLAPQDRRHVQLPRIGLVRTHECTRKLARHLERGAGRVLSATVSFRRGRWQVAFTCEIAKSEPRPARMVGTVGVDLGVQHLAVLSTGEQVPNPKHFDRAQQKLRRAQRQAARRAGPDKPTRPEPSNRWLDAQRRVARLHTQVANARRDGLHQLTTRLTGECDTVVLEDLNVAGMTRSAKGTAEMPGSNVRQKAGLNRRVLDTAPGELRRQLAYKTTWHGRGLVVADRWYPSSKTCSGCGVVKTKLRLSERTYRCDQCGLVLDRDDNAARNLAALADESAGGASTQSCGGTKTSPLETHVRPALLAAGTATGRPHPRVRPRLRSDTQLRKCTYLPIF